MHPNTHPIQKKPRVICLGGLDSSGGAGLAADQKAIEGLGVQFVPITTAKTQQTHGEFLGFEIQKTEEVEKQLQEVFDGFEFDEIPVVKTGMMVNEDIVDALLKHLPSHAILICDPVLKSSSGGVLFEGNIEKLLTRASLVTPNKNEPSGGKAYLKKGGHNSGEIVQDHFESNDENFTLNAPRLPHGARGTGCFLASAIAAGLASGLDMLDAITIARAATQKAIRNAEKEGEHYTLSAGFWPPESQDFPWVIRNEKQAEAFPPIENATPDFYPIVDNIELLEELVEAGITTIQLRIKDAAGPELESKIKHAVDPKLESKIKHAVDIQEQYKSNLFVNDYWQLAIKHGAYGVHLGQEDIEEADIEAIHAAGLRLGLSTHCYFEAAVAHGLKPSYIALGPIYPTNSKEMRFTEQGLDALRLWKQLFDYPLVAIGGIHLDRVDDVIAQKPDLISVIGDVSHHENPTLRAKQWLAKLKA